MTPVYADSSTDAAAALTAVAETYKRHLPDGELRAFPVDGLDGRIGFPVEIASFKFPADHVSGPVQFDGFGYGLTREEAAVGALGELTESAHSETSMVAREPVEGSYDDLVAKHGERAVCDPLTLCLSAGTDYDGSKPLWWAEAKRWGTDETVLVPWEFVAVYGHQMRGRPPLVKTITNGLGAGLTDGQALAHGLLELLQRDGNCTSFRAMDRGVVIELDAVTDPSVREMFDRLRAAGLDVTAKLAGTEFGLVNAYVVGRDTGEGRLPIQTTACGEASHLDRERALRKAAVEFAAARSRKAFMHGPLDLIEQVAPDWYLPSYREEFDPAGEEPRALEAMRRWTTMSQGELEALLAPTVFADHRRVKLSELPTVEPASIADPAARVAAVCDRLAAEGLDVLYADFTPAGQDEIAVVRAVVPGLEGETMSYGRIGERGVRRLMEQGSDLVGFVREQGGEASGAKKRVPLTAAAEERLGGPVWFDTDAAERTVGELYALYREPSSHAVPLSEEASKKT